MQDCECRGSSACSVTHKLGEYPSSAVQVGMDEEGIGRSFLILGGTGNVGKHVVLALSQCTEVSAKVYVGTRQPEMFRSQHCSPTGSQVTVEPVQCDLSCPKSVASTVASVAANSVLLCLPQSLAPKEMETVSNAVVDAAKKAGAKRLVRVASLGIDGGDGQGALGAAHVACEAHCHAAGLPLSSIRPTSFHTNFLTYDAESLRKEGCFRSPLGREAKVNWVHCQDIGRVAAVLLQREETPGRGDEVFEVTGPPEATLSAPEMACLLSEELGRPIQYEEVTPPPLPEYAQLWAFLRAGGFDCSTGVASFNFKATQILCTFSTGTVGELTGKPPTDFRSIVRENKTMLGCKL